MATQLTRDEAREHLRKITRALLSNQGYTEPLSELEIDGWIAFLQALKLVDDEPA